VIAYLFEGCADLVRIGSRAGAGSMAEQSDLISLYHARECCIMRCGDHSGCLEVVDDVWKESS